MKYADAVESSLEANLAALREELVLRRRAFDLQALLQILVVAVLLTRVIDHAEQSSTPAWLLVQ